MSKFVGSNTKPKKSKSSSSISKHNNRTLIDEEIDETLLKNKIKKYNETLQEEEKYFHEIDYEDLPQEMKVNNYYETFKDPLKEIEEIKEFHKEHKKYLNEDKQNLLIEQVVFLSHEQVQEVFKEYGIEEGRNKIIESFKKISQDMELDYNMKPLEMSVHFDEGDIKKEYEEDKITLKKVRAELNVHCHLTYSNFDMSYENTKKWKGKNGEDREKTTKGRTIARNFHKKEMRQHQNLVFRNFKHLGFERGVDKRKTNSSHLDNSQMEEIRLKELTKKVNNNLKIKEDLLNNKIINENIKIIEEDTKYLKDINEDKTILINDIIDLKDNIKDIEEIRELETKREELTPKIEELETKIEELKNSKKDITLLNVSNEEKKKLHKEVQSQMKELRTLRNTYKTEIKKIDKDKKESLKNSELLNETNKDKTRELKELTKTIDKVKHTIEKTEEQEDKENRKLIIPIINKIKDIPMYSPLNDNKKIFIRNEIYKPLNKILKEKSISESSLKDLEILKTKNQELENNIDSYKTDIKTLKTEHKEEKEQILKENNNFHKQEILTLKEDNEKVIKKLENKINTLEEDKQDLTEDINKKIEIIKVKENRIDKDFNTISKLKTKNNELENNKERGNNKIEELETKIEDLNKDIEKLEEKSGISILEIKNEEIKIMIEERELKKSKIIKSDNSDYMRR